MPLGAALLLWPIGAAFPISQAQGHQARCARFRLSRQRLVKQTSCTSRNGTHSTESRTHRERDVAFEFKSACAGNLQALFDCRSGYTR